MLANNKIYLCSNEETIYDPNYRYKVDAPIYEYRIKKGADITCFINSVSFAKSIQLDHALLIRILGSELSCKSYIDKDTKCGVFQGIHEKTKINNIICSVIQNYLLCQTCDRPETTLYVKKNKLRQCCKACGEKKYVIECNNAYELILKSLM